MGPQADSFITLICGNYVNTIQANTFKVINGEGMMFFTAKFLDEKENPLYWVLADNYNGQKLISYLHTNQGIFDFNFIGEEAWNSYRIEQGIPAAPNEINDQYNPHEVNLLDLVSFTKGCYIGQEVIARLDTYDKVQKKLTGIVFPEPMENNGPLLLYNDAYLEVGAVTSTAYSYKLKKHIGLGVVRKAFLGDDVHLIAKNVSKSMAITLQSLPFKK
jgi:folate-binding protein YgfZ